MTEAFAHDVLAYLEGKAAARKEHAAFVKRMQDALGTGETGEALIEVARNAHAAEMECAALIREREGACGVAS